MLVHGDCVDELEKIKSESIDLIVTDPPYSITKNGKSCREAYMPKNKTGTLFSDPIIDSFVWMKECFRVLKKDSHFYTFVNINDITKYLNDALSCGFKLHNIIHVIKDTKMPNRWYLKYTEMILFFRKGKAFPINDLCSRDYIHVNMPTVRTGKLHVTEKPLDLIQNLISNSSLEHDTVLDLFMGSGTTCIASRNLNRKFIGIEKDLDTFLIAKKRLE